MKYKPNLEKPWQDIFHIHTKRCGHAFGEDYEYIEAAIKLGAEQIVFTDHVPFPGDPFGNRMKISEKDEYLNTLGRLQQEYAGRINVLKGFEIEYLPSFKGYYKELKADDRIDVMLLGQHMYECHDGTYSFSLPSRAEEYKGLADAIFEGAETGLFDVIAHPERIFMRCTNIMDDSVFVCMYKIIQSLQDGMYMEYNYSSAQTCTLFEYFWIRAEGALSKETIIKGYDAHSVEEMQRFWKEYVNQNC